jgi:molecular chaperone GrpE
MRMTTAKTMSTRKQPDRETPPEESAPEADVQALVAERDANYDRWLRAQAELENLRRRTQKEADETRKYAALPFVRDLLPGLDNLGRAIAAAQSSRNCDELIQGVELVYRQLGDVLARHGLVPIEAVGKPFDPNRHEAVQQVPSVAHPPMTVLDEAERGYVLHDRVVRPSRVVVSSAPPQHPPAGDDESTIEAEL